MILWLHGIPGAGKTKLVSKVVDDLTNRSHDEALAYFYCDRNDEPRRVPANILRSFVKQLAISPEKDAVHHSLMQIYHQKAESGFNSKILSFEESETVLGELIGTYQCATTTLVVDALDECHESLRRELIEAFDRLIDKSTNLKILVSSRRNADIMVRLERKASVGISATDNQNDISKFVADKIEKNKKDRLRPIKKEVQEQIIETLLVKSEGMKFQWASLQIDQVLKLERTKDIQERLEKLPKGLKKAYDEIYKSIREQDGSNPDIANRAFQWVMCSVRPLSPEELVVAVCQNPDIDNLEDVDINIRVVLSACQNLLDVDENRNVCRFAHLSVQEYFEQHCWNSSQINGLVAKVCLCLLNNPDYFEKESSIIWQYGSLKRRNQEDSSQKYQYSNLLQYARNYWPNHIQRHDEVPADDRLSALLKQFLGSVNESAPAYQSWYKMFQEEEQEETNILLYYHHDELRPSTLASLAICFFGFYSVLPGWCELGFTNVEQRNERGGHLILLAALGGHEKIVELLVSKGADINARGRHYGNALQAALWRGHKRVVELLRSKGAVS